MTNWYSCSVYSTVGFLMLVPALLTAGVSRMASFNSRVSQDTPPRMLQNLLLQGYQEAAAAIHTTVHI